MTESTKGVGSLRGSSVTSASSHGPRIDVEMLGMRPEQPDRDDFGLIPQRDLLPIQ